jgi:anti-sigma factor RsiW
MTKHADARGSKMVDPLPDEAGHLSDTNAAAYLDRGLLIAERDRVEAHLASCPDCRAHLIETRRILSHSRRPKRLAIIGSVVAAAAVLIFVVRPGAHPVERFAPVEVMRGASEPARLIAYGPAGETRASALRFVWSATPGVTTYRLSVTRADGESVWSQGSEDTSLSLPDSVTLRVNQRYFWVADALFGDGRTLSTGLREFDLVP